METLSSPTGSRPIVLFVFTLAGLLSASFVLAARPADVLINEIAWMGTESSYADEWLELYNNTESSINLDGWILREIDLTGTITSRGFYLLERTDDNTLPNIPANQVYAGALNNNGEILELYDSLGNLIDSANCQSGWLAGDNSTKQTMERKDDQDWQTSQHPGGTPKAENSQGEISAESTLIEAKPDLTEKEDKQDVAATNEQISTQSSFPLFISLIIAVFSGIIILVFKRKLN